MITYDDKDTYLRDLENDFNQYSEENNLDITFKREVYSTTNITLNAYDYGSLVEAFLKKTNNPYDMFMVDSVYTRRYAKYSANLKDYISKETIENYFNKGLASKSCVYKDKIVAIVNIWFYYNNNNKNNLNINMNIK